MPEKYLRRDGLPLLLRHTGQTTLPEQPPKPATGPTVICLHDAGLQSSIFADLLSSLTGDGSTCAGLSFDLPGHGRSGGLDALASIAEMAESASWVASWCQIERPILVGHGMGALVALEWVRTKSGSVGGLVLCGIGRALAVDDDTIETMRRVTRGKAPRPFDPSRVAKDGGPDLMKRAYMEGIATDPRATLGDLEASKRWCDALESSRSDGEGGSEASGSRLDCPTLFVDGASEADDFRARSVSFAQSVGDSPVRLIEGASHYLPFERPQAFAEKIGRFAETASTA